MKRSRIILGAASVALMGAMFPGVAGAVNGPPLSLATIYQSVEAGSTIDVSGGGCPATGEFAVRGEPVAVLFTPVDGNHLGFAAEGTPPEISTVMTSVGTGGDAFGKFDVDADGRWSGSLVVPADAPTERRYQLVVACATRVAEHPERPGEADIGGSDATHVVSGITIGAEVIDSAEPPTTSTAPIASTTAVPHASAVTSPRFVG